jgi:hypothetical protein
MGAHHPKVATVRDIGQAFDINLGVLFRYGQIQIVQERKRFVLVAPYNAAGRSILDFQAFQARGFVVRHPECVVNLLSDRKAIAQRRKRRIKAQQRKTASVAHERSPVFMARRAGYSEPASERVLGPVHPLILADLCTADGSGPFAASNQN